MKLSQASNRIADGAVEPGRNIEIEEAGSSAEKFKKRNDDYNVQGTFCTMSQTSGPMIRMPSGSVTTNVAPG